MQEAKRIFNHHACSVRGMLYPRRFKAHLLQINQIKQIRIAYQSLRHIDINICGYSKEPSKRDGSFEHPKQKLKLMGKNALKMVFI